MPPIKIYYTQDAIDDLDVIFNYISEDNKQAALRMVDRLEAAILRLADNPRLGAVLPVEHPSIINPGYRRIVVKPYNVFYRILNNSIFIGRVLHGRQNWMQLIFDLDFE